MPHPLALGLGIKLEVSHPPADIQLLERQFPQNTPSIPPLTAPEIQYSSGRRGAVYSFISHMAKRSAAFLNQRITLSFFPTENRDSSVGTAAGRLTHQAVVLNSQVQDWI